MRLGLGLSISQQVGSGAFSPAAVSGLWTWLDPSDASYRTEGGGGTTITALTDKSGNTRNATSAGADPSKGTGINGLVTLSFPGTANKYLNLPNTSALTVAEAFIVCKADAQTPATGRGLWHVSTGGDAYHPFSDGNVYESFGAAAWKLAGSNQGNLSVAHVWNVISASGEWTALKNGTQIFTTATNTPAFPATPWLGRSFGAVGFVGDIGELVLYSRKLTTTERGDVKAYLSSKWGTP